MCLASMDEFWELVVPDMTGLAITNICHLDGAQLSQRWQFSLCLRKQEFRFISVTYSAAARELDHRDVLVFKI